MKEATGPDGNQGDVLDLDHALGRSPRSIEECDSVADVLALGRSPAAAPRERLFTARGPDDQDHAALFFQPSAFGGDDLTFCLAKRGGPEVHFDVEPDEVMRIGEFLIGWARPRITTGPLAPLNLPAAMPRMISADAMGEATIPELLLMTLGGERGAFSYDNPLCGLARIVEEEIRAIATFAPDATDGGEDVLAGMAHRTWQRARLLAELLERCQVAKPKGGG
jgi:hypothetical protein